MGSSDKESIQDGHYKYDKDKIKDRGTNSDYTSEEEEVLSENAMKRIICSVMNTMKVLHSYMMSKQYVLIIQN